MARRFRMPGMPNKAQPSERRPLPADVVLTSARVGAALDIIERAGGLGRGC